MRILVQSAGLFLIAVFLLATGCGQPEVKVPATPDNAVEARNQMRTVRSQIKSSGAPYLQELIRRGDGLERSGSEAMEAKNYVKALSSFAEARKCYKQAVDMETDFEAKREAVNSVRKEAEAARAAASAVSKADARPESFVAATNAEKEGEDALIKEDFEKAKKLFTLAAAGFKAAQADGAKLMRAELSGAALAAKKEVDAVRKAAMAASKADARPASFAAAVEAEKGAEEALDKEDFVKAKELFVRAAEGYRTAQAEAEKSNRDEMSRAAYAKKKEAEAEYLTAAAASRPDTRPVSFVNAGNSMKEGGEALAKEDFAKAKEHFTRALESYKAAQSDTKKLAQAEISRAAWTKQLAEVDAALLGRQAAAEFAKLKSQAESAIASMAANPGPADQQLTAATAALKELFDQARTKENLPKSGPVVAQLENALRSGNWLLAHRTLGQLEQLIPSDPRMADFRTKAAAVPWPNEVSLDLGGGAIVNFVLIRPGSFSMGEGSEKHQVTLTKPFFIGKYEVTQQQWQTVMGSNPSARRDNKNPVENICWDTCQDFWNKLNARLSGVKALLPTEAQWEYACRAGSTTKFYYGDDATQLKDYAVYPFDRGYHSFETRTVGTKKPNAWGLYDMHGNVAEFCSDRYGNLPSGAQEDPQGPASGSDRVLRGGSCRDGPVFLSSASRRGVMPGNVLDNAGLRLVLVTDAIATYQASLVKSPDVPAAPVASTPTTPPPSTTPAPVASSTTPSTPSVTTTAPVAADEWMKGIPPRALPGYLQARSDAQAGKGLIGMRSWRAMWGNRLRDPARGYVELEFADLLLSDPTKTDSASAEEQKKKQNLQEAAIIVRSIRARNVTDPGLLSRLEDTAKKLP